MKVEEPKQKITEVIVEENAVEVPTQEITVSEATEQTKEGSNS